MINQQSASVAEKTIGRLPPPVAGVLAPIIVVVFSFVSYRTLIIIDAEFAKIVSGGILTSVLAVYKYLKNNALRLNFLAARQGETNMDRFTLKWYFVLIYGGLALLGIIEIISAVSGFIVTIFVTPSPDVTITITVLNSVIVFPIFVYVFGTWVGRKSDSYGWLLVLTTVLLVRIVDFLLVLFLPSSMLVESFGLSKSEYLAELFTPVSLVVLAITSLLHVTLGVLGYWQGRKEQAAERLRDLMAILPNDTQDTIVNIVYEEAQKMSSRRESLNV